MTNSKVGSRRAKKYPRLAARFAAALSAVTLLVLAILVLSGRGSATSRGVTLAVQDVAQTASPSLGSGYWLVTSAGQVYAYGGATNYGDMVGHHLNKTIVGISSTPDGRGYWLFAEDGGVFAFGDAAFYGSQGATGTSSPGSGRVECAARRYCRVARGNRSCRASRPARTYGASRPDRPSRSTRSNGRYRGNRRDGTTGTVWANRQYWPGGCDRRRGTDWRNWHNGPTWIPWSNRTSGAGGAAGLRVHLQPWSADCARGGSSTL